MPMYIHKCSAATLSELRSADTLLSAEQQNQSVSALSSAWNAVTLLNQRFSF